MFSSLLPKEGKEKKLPVWIASMTVHLLTK
jgi:hypothetical protein